MFMNIALKSRTRSQFCRVSHANQLFHSFNHNLLVVGIYFGSSSREWCDCVLIFQNTLINLDIGSNYMEVSVHWFFTTIYIIGFECDYRYQCIKHQTLQHCNITGSGRYAFGCASFRIPIQIWIAQQTNHNLCRRTNCMDVVFTFGVYTYNIST